ncbi:hypothetical protein CY35_14G003800 [Sphagnum magellanicum]|nr:hypothetical protein CY35_14G003800 [Sphagnum magellanicum]
MGSSRNRTLYVDLLSQPCRAVAIFCRGSSNVIASTPNVEWCKLSHCASTSCPLTSMDKGMTIITM